MKKAFYTLKKDNEVWGKYHDLTSLLNEMDTLKNPQFFEVFKSGKNITRKILLKYYSNLNI